MSSGYENIVINPLERAVSTDINRLEAFAGADISELFRMLLNVQNGTDDLDAGALFNQITTTTSPVAGEIINGALVKPQIGSLSLLIEPSVMFLLDLDSPASPDDSSYKYLRDPGITSTGVLSMTANSSGSTRFDVIECARVSAPGYSVLETDSRDIFNPTTGLFTPTTVNKVIAGRLQYRVRAGTPGSGFPGTATGWLPLAVAQVPTATTTNDTIVFWDVRPLLNDREFNLTSTTKDFASADCNFMYSSVDTGNIKAKGYIEARLNGRKVGGRIRPGTPVTDNDFILLGPSTTENWSSGLSLAADSFYYLYLVTPYSLPRWARYTDSTSGARKPRSPRGIFVLSATAPGSNNKPSSAVNLPASFGTASTSDAICVSAFRTDDTAALIPTNCMGRRHVAGYGGSFTVTGFSPSSFDDNLSTYAMTVGTRFPSNARYLHVTAETDYNAHGPGGAHFFYFFQVEDNASNIVFFENLGLYSSGPPAGTSTSAQIDVQSRWLPVPQNYPGSPLSFTLKVHHGLSAVQAPDASNTVTGANLIIDGWEIW